MDDDEDTDHLWAAYEHLRDQTERLGAALYARLNLPVSAWQDDIDEYQRHQAMPHGEMARRRNEVLRRHPRHFRRAQSGLGDD